MSRPGRRMSVNGDSVRHVAGGIAPWVLAAVATIGFFWNPRDDTRQVELRLDEKITQAERRSGEAINALDRRINEINLNYSKLLLTIAEYTEFKVRKDNDTVRQDEVIRMLARTREDKEEHKKDMTVLTERINGEREALSKLQESVGGGGVGKQLDNLKDQLAKQAEITAAQIVELRRALDMRTPGKTNP